MQKCILFILLPLSGIYAIFMLSKRAFARPKRFSLPIISVGNITVGGSGKTPLILALAREYEKPCIILRGYKRDSKGLHVVSHFGKIQTTLSVSGDEAMLYAKSLDHALVIVSEDRIKAIQKAKELGAKVVFLDDGFGKVHIKKFDIVIAPNENIKNPFCLPSGGFREPKSALKYADMVLADGVDFKREVKIVNQTPNMVLVTAIANASRLDMYLPKSVTKKYIYPDHHAFSKEELKRILEDEKASSILTTQKDFVKMQDFNLPISLMDLHIVFHTDVKNKIDNYLINF